MRVPRINRLEREATFLHCLLHISKTRRQELLLVGISGFFERYYLVCLIFRSFFFFGVLIPVGGSVVRPIYCGVMLFISLIVMISYSIFHVHFFDLKIIS